MFKSLLSKTGMVVLFCAQPLSATQNARITEETRTIETYGFSEPNPVPILTRDSRLYPYHSFDAYSHESEPREWKVIHLENDLIEVWVLPEAGGKVWGARVKDSGHEFIYRNEVMKFRNIALRGPWTSGGIEFNFGVIGHTPATATPVDYALRSNEDGSVSAFVGTMDLPSRTHWRVEIRLPADKAYFETNVSWSNPTPLEQPYYNWMTGAAFARTDLEMTIPGNAYLTHPGEERPWPVDPEGRYLPSYANNTFGPHKSYHVVGELNDFFGGYYTEEDYGFGHWARFEDMPGQKLWLWALSRQGGIWEGLLTDTDGQYVEFQAGRMLVQYSPGSEANPIAKAGFEPGASDHWSETWFPLEGIGGLTDASREGAMFVQHEEDRLTVSINSFSDIRDTLRVWVDGSLIEQRMVNLKALDALDRRYNVPDDSDYRIRLSALDLDYSSSTPEDNSLGRPFAADPHARDQMTSTDINAFEASQLLRARRYRAARERFTLVLVEEPWRRDGLLGMAGLEFQAARYDLALQYITRALRLDAYDAKTNFLAGNIYRALGRTNDARDSFGWAARSMGYRAAAYVYLAEIMLAENNLPEAARYAGVALDYDRYNLSAREVLAMTGRLTGDSLLASQTLEELLALDPLHHFVAIEEHISGRTELDFDSIFRSEYPDQTVLELTIDYHRRGATDDARALLELGKQHTDNPLLDVWLGWLDEDVSHLAEGAMLDFVFPFRRETLPVLEWAANESAHWSWGYLLALNLWALDRPEEAAVLMEELGQTPDFAPAYVARANLLFNKLDSDPEFDLRKAVELGADTRSIWIRLISYLQDHSRWEDALAVSEEARARFSGDFNLDLLHVKSLNNLDREQESIEILAATQVLPSEHARDSHLLYEQAHILAAFRAIDIADYDAATNHLHMARAWPENLGQGRPYQPEDRLTTYLLGIIQTRMGDNATAQASFSSVIQDTEPSPFGAGPLDLLAIPALVALDRTDVLRDVDVFAETRAGSYARRVIELLDSPGSIDQFNQLSAAFNDLFSGLSGRILLNTLGLAP